MTNRTRFWRMGVHIHALSTCTIVIVFSFSSVTGIRRNESLLAAPYIYTEHEAQHFLRTLGLNILNYNFFSTPVTDRVDPEGSRKLRLLDFLTTAQYGGRLSALGTGRHYPQECSWYSFSLGAESTPGPWFGRKEIYHWKIQWHHRESIPGPSD